MKMLSRDGLAVLHYGPADFDIVQDGSYVLCAVTGERIPLDQLVYWSADHQEAYRGPHEATAAMLAGGAGKVE